VKDVLLLARTHLTTAIRERITLFWFLVFPVFVLVLLTLIFSRVGEEGEIHFDIALVNRDGGSSASLSLSIVDAFRAMGAALPDGKEPLFTVYEPAASDDVDRFLEDELTALRRGRRAAVIVIPQGLSGAVANAMTPAAATPPPSVAVYMSGTSVASEMAAEIVGQVLAEFDRQLLAQSGRLDPSAELAAETIWLGQAGEGTRYVDFLLPGIILMAFFTNGLFGVPGTILFNRDRKILRRYWVTPLSIGRFLAGFSIGHLGLCALQFALLFLLGRFAFGATVSFAHPTAFLTLLFSALTFLAFGFLIASLARTANAGMATANILNMPMMFLSGMFFPIAGLPAFLLAIVYANPVSYLANALRASVGVESPLFSPALLVGVPLGWIALSVAVAIRKLKWDVGR